MPKTEKKTPEDKLNSLSDEEIEEKSEESLERFKKKLKKYSYE